MTTQTQQGVTNTNQINPGFPIVGGDGAGSNLVIRSTSNGNKGAVIFDEATSSFGPNSGAVQAIGGIGSQNNVSVGGQFINMPYGYSVSNVIIPPGFGGDYRGYYNLVPTGATRVYSSYTVTFSAMPAQNAPPFIVGQSITVSGVVPVTYNGVYTVTACTTTSVTFAVNYTDPGVITTQGFVFQTISGVNAPSITVQAPQLPNSAPASINPVMNNQTLMVTAGTNSAGTTTLTFVNPYGSATIPPFAVGQYIRVQDVTPTSGTMNGVYAVTACTATQVSYLSTASGPITQQGTVSSGYVVGTNVVYPGTGYTQQPQITFSDPVAPGQTVYYQAQNGFALGAVPQSLAITGLSNATGPIAATANTSITAVSGTTVTVASTTNLNVGQPILVAGVSGGIQNGLYNGVWYIASLSPFTLATTLQNALWNLPYTFGSGSMTGTVTVTSQIPTYISQGFVTFSFSSLGSSIVPFYPGQQIQIQGTGTGIAGSGSYNQYNGTWIVWTASNTTVTISTGVTGSLSANGTVTSLPNACPTLFIKAPQSNGQVYYYQVSYPGYLGASTPTHTVGLAVNGTAGLTYVGSVATGQSAIGYSGIITAGAVHQVGAVTNIIITFAGTGYTAPPQVLLSGPQVAGGRQAIATATVASGSITAINIVDAGSGYLYPPSVTFVGQGGQTAVASATAVIGNPGEKPIVSTLVPQVAFGSVSANTYVLDFGLNGHNVVFLQTAASSTFYFDNYAQGSPNATPYNKGFPLGRRIILYVKNTSGSGITLTFSNLQANNAGSTGTTPTLAANKTLKVEFIVLSQGSLLNQTGAGYAGGSIHDVYATMTTT